MDQRVGRLWGGYRRAARRLYEGSDDRPWEGFLQASDQLAGALFAGLPDNGVQEGAMEYDPDLETVAVAAAAIDAAVAADMLDGAEEEKELARARGILVSPLIELAVPDLSEREPVLALLEEADGLFPEGEVMRGSAPWPPHAGEKAEVAIDRLVEGGTSLAGPCCVGLLTLGVTDLISAVGGLGALDAIAVKVARRASFGLRLLRSAALKVLATVGRERLIEAAVDLSSHIGLDGLATRSGIDVWAVGLLVRRRRSEKEVDEILASHAPVEANLETRLEKLCADYDRNMRWGRRYATSLKFAAPAAVLIGLGPPGAAGIAAANGIGLTYGLFSLSDRLDTNPLVRRMDGVPTRVRYS